MQSADDVKLGDCLGKPLSCGIPCLFESHSVSVRLALLAAKGAEPARGDTDVCGIDMAVHVEVGQVSMQPLADEIGHPANGEDVAAAIQCKTVVEAQTFSG